MIHDPIKVCLWVTLGALHLPTLALPFLYWARRQYDPIRGRRPALFTQCLTVCVVFLWLLIVRNAAGAWVGIWIDLVLQSSVLIAIFESFFVFAWSLYVAYRRTQIQMALRESALPAPLLRSLRWTTIVMSNGFTIAWVWGNVVVWMAVLVGYAQPLRFYSTPVNDVESGSVEFPFPWFMPLLMGRVLVTIGGILILSFRLRHVSDAFGTKALLRRIGISTMISSVFYVGTTIGRTADVPMVDAQDLVSLITTDFVLWTAFIQPIWQTRPALVGASSRSALAMAEAHREKTDDFQRFLQTDEGFVAFKQHLEKEFAVENLLFWHDVQDFRRNPDARTAQLIFERYVSASAPFEINLPSAMLQDFRQTVFGDGTDHQANIHGAMFDDAADQILHLMEVNSLGRFLKTQPPSWDRYMNESQTHLPETISNDVVDVSTSRSFSLASITSSMRGARLQIPMRLHAGTSNGGSTVT